MYKTCLDIYNNDNKHFYISKWNTIIVFEVVDYSLCNYFNLLEALQCLWRSRAAGQDWRSFMVQWWFSKPSWGFFAFLLLSAFRHQTESRDSEWMNSVDQDQNMWHNSVSLQPRDFRGKWQISGGESQQVWSNNPWVMNMFRQAEGMQHWEPPAGGDVSTEI